MLRNNKDSKEYLENQVCKQSRISGKAFHTWYGIA